MAAAAVAAPSGAARAEPSPSGAAAAAAPDTAKLLAERARLRVELDRVNAEIDALKRTGGVSDRLRSRLADAEGIARRLMDIEARLGIRTEAAGAAPRPLAQPTAAREDGPADLDAKADILADQSRRLRGQADALANRARELKARQELRRRSAELDRDPFAAMEGAKRRVASATNTAAAPAAVPTGDTRGGGSTSLTGQGTPSGGGAAPGSMGPSSATQAPGSTITTAPVAAPSPTTSAGTDAPSSLAVQLRDLVDTATLADIRRLEGRGSGGTSQALEKAAAALRARAAELDARAKTMRAQAHPPGPAPVVIVPAAR